VLSVVSSRHQSSVAPCAPGRDVLQLRVDIGDKTYLVRVFVDIDRNPAEVVTVYLTSRIGKYWEAS
jgi:hypothetical protein